jgi:putative hemolysin
MSAVQIGVTVAGFFSAAYGASAIAPGLEPLLDGWGLQNGAASAIALIVTTLVISYLSLVLGELVPKRIALQRATSVALLAGPVLDKFAFVMRPVIRLLSVSTDLVVRALGGDPAARGEEVTHDDLRDMVHQTAIPEQERMLLSEVFDAVERSLAEVMLPRTEVHFLEASARIADVRDDALHGGHIRYPVTGRSLDDVVGVVHVRDLILADPDATVRDVCHEVLHLPMTIPALTVLHDLRLGDQQFAVVVDEYGGTAGIVTLEDIVEEIIGEIGDRNAGRESNSDVGCVDGLMIVEDFSAETGVVLPDGDYETVAGFVQERLQHLPVVGDSVVVGRHRLIVDALDGRRVASVRLVMVDDEKNDEV